MSNYKPIKQVQIIEHKVEFIEFLNLKFKLFAIGFHVVWKLLGLYRSWWWVIGAVVFIFVFDILWYNNYPPKRFTYSI